MFRSTALKTDEEDRRWSLSWHPDGRSGSFTREAILASAPRVSGIYGLFNFDCQIFIGETASIQDALLRHEKETDFQSRHLRPTGFTFEACAAELRRAKADELIARFHPVLQQQAKLADCRLETGDREVREAGTDPQKLAACADGREAPAHERGASRKAPERRHLSRSRRAARAALVATIAAILYFFGVPPDNLWREEITRVGGKLRERISSAQSLGLARRWLGWEATSSSSTEVRQDLASRRSQPAPADSEILPSPSMMYAAEGAAAKGANTNKTWSVQISAAPAGEIAEALAQGLRAAGYAGYVAPAEVKGKTFYRVRVGPFNSRDEANSVRQSLAGRDGYRDAFLARD